jgi:hypothetical protein
MPMVATVSLPTGLLLAAAVLAGCTWTQHHSSGRGTTPAPRPSPVLTAPSPVLTAPITVGAVREAAADSCPYIDTQAAAGAEGSRIGAISVLSRNRKAMGCRFRLLNGDHHYILEINSGRYQTPTAAYNAMVRTGTAGGQPTGVPGLGQESTASFTGPAFTCRTVIATGLAP